MATDANCYHQIKIREGCFKIYRSNIFLLEIPFVLSNLNYLWSAVENPNISEHRNREKWELLTAHMSIFALIPRPIRYEIRRVLPFAFNSLFISLDLGTYIEDHRNLEIAISCNLVYAITMFENWYTEWRCRIRFVLKQKTFQVKTKMWNTAECSSFVASNNHV